MLDHPMETRMGWPLSPREKQLLRRLALGKSDAEIAMQIGGPAERIAAQRQRLLDKLQISTQDEIAEAARRLARWPPSEGRAPN